MNVTEDKIKIGKNQTDILAKLKYILPLFLFFVTSSILAQEQEQEDEKEIKFEVKAPEKAYIGERFRIIYTLTNADVSDINFPEKIKGFDIIYGPSKSSSHSTQVIGGETTSTSSVSFMFILTPTETGKYKLPEVEVEVKGKKYKSERPQIEVISTGNNSGKNKTESSRKKQDNRQNKKKQEIKDQDAFIKAIVEEEEIDGEKVFDVTLRLYVTDNISGISRISSSKEPDFSAFQIAGRGTSDRRMYRTEYEGKSYYTADIRQYILIPKRSGKVDIDGGSFNIVFRIKTGEVEQSFFGPVEKEVEVEKTLEIDPFSINAGLVGDWHAI